MRKIFLALIFVISQTFGNVESYRNSLFLLLSDKASVDPYESSGVADYVTREIAHDSGRVFPFPIDVSAKSANALAEIFSDRGENSLYAKALENWFLKSSDSRLSAWKRSCGKCSLKDLKISHPDLLPKRFIVISEGVSGLVAREYIQGKDYAGDFSKVLFFDTPHEGSGFADQALFLSAENFSFKTPNVKSLSAAVPLALSAYVFGGADALQDAVISLAKTAVLGLAQNSGKISDAISEANFFSEISKNSDALWYLSADASFDDKKYEQLISAASVSAKNQIGAAQWLNATGMQTKFESPSYGIVYSYGFPSFGNGRRTAEDFIEQSKNHIPKEKLKQVLADSLTNVLSAAGVDRAAVTEEVSKLADEMLSGKISDKAREIAGDLVQKYGALGNVLSDSRLSGYMQGLSELRSLKIHMDDLPGTALKILRVLDKFIPEVYKSELYTTFIENFSPEIQEILGDAASCALSGGAMRNCVVAGLSVSAKNLSNYGLNFFDEGTFDVPAYSAFGKNVSAFKNAGVLRQGYDLGDFVAEGGPLSEYRNLLGEVGRLEKARSTLDLGLRAGCGVLFSPYKEICKAAAFSANVILIADISGKTAKLAESAPALKSGKHLSLGAALRHSAEFSYEGFAEKALFQYPDLEKLLFDSPKISVASVFKKGSGETVDSVVPLMLSGTRGPEIFDEKSLAENCRAANGILYEASFAEKDAVKSAEGKTLAVKSVRYDGSFAQNFWRWKAPTVKKFLYEYRFVIDDLEPDSLRQIRLDFNAAVQMAFERKGSEWFARQRIGNGWSEAKAVKAPVQSDGIFIFRPAEFFGLKLDGEEHLLSAILKEGPNMVRIYAVNKLGFSGSGEFTFLFESTPPLLEPGWPKSFATLSRADKPYIYYNKQDALPKFSGLKVSLLDFDGRNDTVGTAPATFELLDSARGTFKISADLEKLWDRDLASGNYVLEWEVGILDAQGKRQTEKLRTLIFIDREAPKLALTLAEEISGKSAERFGTLTNLGPISDRAIRALRIFVEQNGQTFVVKNFSASTEEFWNFGWDALPPFEGPAKLFVQAIDYAIPSEEFEKLLSDSAAPWNEILQKDKLGNFVFAKGLNGAELTSEIVIDGTAPKIAENSFSLQSSRPKSFGDFPAFERSGQSLILGIADTLKLSFEILEPLLGRDTSHVSVKIRFDDFAHDVHKSYDRELSVTADQKIFTFSEPDANRLTDGIYDIQIRLSDRAGNAFDTTLYKGLAIDRTAPVIVELMNGDVAFSDASELKKSCAYVSQISDKDFNRADLNCFAKVSVGGESSGWFATGPEILSKNGKANVPFEFDIQEKSAALPNGLWTVKLGCFDAAGNYGERSDFFGMGRRYPRITFPEEGFGDYFGESVLIEGTSPNPVIKNGDDKNAKFTVEWCTEDLSKCSTEGVTALSKTISEQPKPLAVWNTKGLAGSYRLRLKVEGCDFRGENCEVAVTERIVSFAGGEKDLSPTQTELPKLELVEFPSGQVPGSDEKIRLRLEGGDTSAWALNVSVKVRSPRDSALFVPAKNVFFDAVSASPFDGEPPVKREGLSVWQNGKTWNVLWKGSAKSAGEIAPKISLRYVKGSAHFIKPQDLPAEDSSVNMPAIDGEQISIPAYDAVRNFEIKDSIHFQFESDSAFIIDISSIRAADRKIFTGKNSVQESAPMLCVFPNRYAATFTWNGLTQENLYPGGSDVLLTAYAYKKSDKTKLVFCEKSWNQAVEDFRIIANENAMREFYVGLFSGDSARAFAQSNFLFEFGIAGQPANVSAEIFGPNGETVKKLLTDQRLLAGTSKTAYSVSWDGTSENGFAATTEGKYTLKISAERDGSVKTLSHDFDLILANRLIPAPTESAAGEYPADLTIDEAFTDEMGNLRYLGNPDYLLEADVSAVTLPQAERTVEYRWQASGTQHPIYFEKNRYSLGIHRHRKKFPVVVGVLIAGYGHDLTSMCNWKNRSYNYRIFLKRIVLEEGKIFSIDKLRLDPKAKIVGFDNDGKTKLQIGISVKIFPESVLKKDLKLFEMKDEIYSAGGHFDHNSIDDPEEKSSHNYTWSLIWNDSFCANGGKCPNENLLQMWWKNFDEHVYWESRKKKFDYNAGSFTLENSAPSLSCKPSDSADNSANGQFVCSDKNDYDVHKNMLKISVSPIDAEKNFSFGSYGGGCSNAGSHKDIAIKLRLEVKNSYWHPQYGYSNLANTFMRFDPENIALFNDQGYCNIPSGPCKIFDGASWKSSTADGKLTAFEAAELSMENAPENPLLFADEFSDSADKNLSLSTYAIKFYNAKVSPIAFRAAAIWNGIQRLDIDSDGADSVVTPEILNPFALKFYVAPKLSAEDAAKSSPGITAPYPFAGDFSEIEAGIHEKCDCKFYRGLASGLHFTVGDWTADDWRETFLTEGLVKNPLTANVLSPRFFRPIETLAAYAPAKNSLDTTYHYAARETDSENLDFWKIPAKEFSRTKPELDNAAVGGNAPAAKFTPQILTPGWTAEESNGEWSATNEGEITHSTATFIWSKQKPWNFNRSDLSHKISLASVTRQDSADKILGKPWMKKVQVENPNVYARGEGEAQTAERKFHPYFTAAYDSAAAEFTVSRSRTLDYTARESETLTLRGRVPAKNQKWNLFYVQGGKQHFLKSGTQDSVFAHEPYPVLDFAEMNRLQGNTSFFLTYGGTKGESYFRKLDLHVGSLLKSGEGGMAQSMYGTVSAEFKPGAFGESDVDVTVRTVPKSGEYNFEAFQNLDIIGPVVEILPSHDFSKLPDTLWPLVHVRLECNALNGADPAELKVYKPNFETQEIMPLETQNVLAFDQNGEALPLNTPDFSARCSEVEIIAKTKSFSTFVVMDKASAQKVGPKDSTAKREFVCGEMPADTLWAGTFNGRLEYPNPCSGSANVLLQLRTNESVEAEMQAASADPVLWELRKSDASQRVYSSRFTAYGFDGKSSQFLGPTVLTDSLAPEIHGVAISTTEDKDSKILQLDVTASDRGSGVFRMQLDVYFGGKLLESRSAKAPTAAENFVLDRETLYGCVGCKASVKISVEDRGKNHAETAVETGKLYPYPQALALWYPLSEGAGTISFEATGNGPDIDLSALKLPWQNGKTLRLFAGDKAQGLHETLADSMTAFSVELKFSAGHSGGAVFGCLGNSPWTIGVDSLRRYFLEAGSGRVSFDAQAERNVQNHIVLTVEGNAVSLYKNGSFVGSKRLAAKFKFESGKPFLGGSQNLGSISGTISDVRIYRSALTAAQISALYLDGLDLNSGDVTVARAVELNRGGLKVDQSCGVAGMAYLRQKNSAARGALTWNADVESGRYNLYLLALGFASEKSHVEIFIDGISHGIFGVESTGLWKSVQVEGATLGLKSGANQISVRPLGNLGIAALALVKESKNLPADKIDYGEGSWKNPAARVTAKMRYENPNDSTWARPKIRLQNLTAEAFSGVKVRYYYRGEGASVQATSFYPNVPMSISPDAGDVYFGELALTETVPAYGTPYYGEGPQFGLHRSDFYFPWNTSDDPSFAKGANENLVKADGIAVLDSEGFLLNDWSCYDASGPANARRKSVRVLAKDSKAGSTSSLITMLVENTGEVPVEGFEARYYFREQNGSQVDVYHSPFASHETVNSSGDLRYVSFRYAKTVLNPGEKSDFGNGVNFEIHSPDWTADFDALDDPSHRGLNAATFAETDSAVVLDLNGNLLWGNAPSPNFAESSAPKSPKGLIEIEGDVAYVNAPAAGAYTLETVNAAGTPLVNLFCGTWTEGEHSVSLKDFTFAPGSYLVLRQGKKILAWQLFN